MNITESLIHETSNFFNIYFTDLVLGLIVIHVYVRKALCSQCDCNHVGKDFFFLITRSQKARLIVRLNAPNESHFVNVLLGHLEYNCTTVQNWQQSLTFKQAIFTKLVYINLIFSWQWRNYSLPKVLKTLEIWKTCKQNKLKSGKKRNFTSLKYLLKHTTHSITTTTNGLLICTMFCYGSS